MNQRQPLPPELASTPFRVSKAREHGVADKRLRALDLDASVWGTRAPKTRPTFAAWCARFALRMPPTAFFSHVTAARLLGIPVPLRLEADPLVDIAVASPARAPHASGIRGHALSVGREDVVQRGPLRITTPARTWCDLAGILSLRELVAAGDFTIARRLPLASVADLESTSHDFSGRRGVALIRQALPLLSDRAESVPESELRVILHLGGLPAVDVNYVVVNAETGRDIRLDLAFTAYKIVLEYQGDYHRDRAQWRKDMTRRARLEAQGWYVLEINADDLRNPVELVERVRAVLQARGWR